MPSVRWPRGLPTLPVPLLSVSSWPVVLPGCLWYGQGHHPHFYAAVRPVWYDNLFWCSAVFGTYALIGVALASVLRWRGERRAMAVSNAVTIVLGGVSEPTLYASVLPYKVNMVALFLGGFWREALSVASLGAVHGSSEPVTSCLRRSLPAATVRRLSPVSSRALWRSSLVSRSPLWAQVRQGKQRRPGRGSRARTRSSDFA